MRNINIIEVLLTLLAIVVMAAIVAGLVWLMASVVRDIIFLSLYVYLIASGGI